jgi:hypothetical protein
MTMTWKWVIIAATAGQLAACGGEEEAPRDAAGTPSAAGEAASAPTAETVWAQLESANYRSWRLWPGTSERYEGTEPHGMLLTTYVNDLALQALENGTLPLPDGAIVVKENYMPDGTFDASTVMVKRAGYAPEHNDWFWAKYDAAGNAEVAGRAEMCQACHSANRQRDHLMTPLPDGVRTQGGT